MLGAGGAGREPRLVEHLRMPDEAQHRSATAWADVDTASHFPSRLRYVLRGALFTLRLPVLP
ncbi:hypothetical protein GCM10027610_073840 [Dactylosporangium cerinum]